MTNVQIIVRRKITAVAQGERIQNLGIPRAREIIGDNEAVDLTVDSTGAPDAMALAEKLAREAGMVVIERGGDAYIMCRPNVADTYRKPVTPPQASVVEFEGDIPPLAARQRGGLIVLSPLETFTSYAKVKEFVVKRTSWGEPAKPSERFHTDLTKTFFDGRPSGQIHSLFRDLKRFGIKAIAPKIKEFQDFAERAPDPIWAKYNAWRKHGMTPDLVQTHRAPNRVDSDYFKYYLLLDLLKDFTAAQNAN